MCAGVWRTHSLGDRRRHPGSVEHRTCPCLEAGSAEVSGSNAGEPSTGTPTAVGEQAAPSVALLAAQIAQPAR